MFKKILLLLTCFAIFILPLNTFAANEAIESAYSSFLQKIERKYQSDMQQTILKDLSGRLEEFSETTSNTALISVVDELQKLNNEALYEIWLSLETNPSKQKIQELREISAFELTLESTILPKYITDVIGGDISYIRTNDGREFLSNNTIQRIIYSSYVPVSESNASRLQGKTGIIIYDNTSGYRYMEDYSFEEKIPYSILSKRFQSFLTENHRVNQRNNNYYGYNFLNFKFFEDKYGVYNSSLESSGFDLDSTLLYMREDGGYNFVTEYDEYKIASVIDLYGVPEKHLLLDYLREDAKFETTDIASQLQSIKSLSNTLTQGKSREESVESIYAWILGNIEYSSIIDLNNEKIFSGIETFKNGEGVCTGYTKLSSYLFYFAGYHDVEVIRGHVIDAQDFPQIGHAWLKIGDLYYDPTFDDPIGAQNTKSPSDYKYFGLPKDIFYANRYEYGDLPEYLNTASETEISQHIFSNLSSLIPKYQNSLDQYPVFAGVAFRNTYNISSSETITPKLLSQKIGSYTVENNSFKFIDNNGTQKQILGFNYYPLTIENTSSVLDILGYDTSEIKLFNWQKASGEYEWRLAYDLEIR